MYWKIKYILGNVMSAILWASIVLWVWVYAQSNNGSIGDLFVLDWSDNSTANSWSDYRLHGENIVDESIRSNELGVGSVGSSEVLDNLLLQLI